MDYKDYYAALDIKKGASADDIQKAYRKLARKYHPDVNHEPGAEDRFKEISEAYEVLKDPQKRATYDRFGSAWAHQGGRRGGGPPPGFEQIFGGMGGGMGGDSGFSSFFEALFGGGGGGADPFAGFSGFSGGGQRARRGADQEATLRLTLREAALGGQRELTLTDPATGQPKTLAVNLPAGIQSGRKLRLAGRGAPAPGGGQAGDLFLKIEIQSDPRFELDGHHLRSVLPISPWQAALGGQATLETLEGPLTIRVPPGSSSGRKIRLRGKGFPNPKGEAGDLFAEIRVMVPEELTPEERALFEQLQDVSSFEPN